jgi:hypothetical protein
VHHPNARLHLFVLAVFLVLLTISTGFSALALITLSAVSTIPAIIWHERREYDKRDAALTLPWGILSAGMIPAVIIHSTQLRFPMQDAAYIAMDRALGFNVPGIMEWFSWHRSLSRVLDYRYWLLDLFLLAAVIVPAVTGKKKIAEQLLIANLFAFVFALPIFTLAPAVGPWAGFQFAGTARQKAVETGMAALQTASICFPSFHAIWAVFAVWSLWHIKPLRIPFAILTFLVVVSTVTTGWHYVVDTLAGIIFAPVALACARIFLDRYCSHSQGGKQGAYVHGIAIPETSQLRERI